MQCFAFRASASFVYLIISDYKFSLEKNARCWLYKWMNKQKFVRKKGKINIKIPTQIQKMGREPPIIAPKIVLLFYHMILFVNFYYNFCKFVKLTPRPLTVILGKKGFLSIFD